VSDENSRRVGKKDAPTDSERARAARQAKALRANLRKRNAQRRGRRSDAPDSGSSSEDA